MISESCIDDKNMYEKINKLRSIPVFSNISEMKILELAKHLDTCSFSDNETVIKQGAEGDNLYLLNQGKCKIYIDNKYIREIEAFTCFGEKIFGNQDNGRTATVIANGNIECYTLKFEKFKEILDPKLVIYIQKMISIQDFSITVNNLYYIRDLGVSRFGKVYLAHNEKNFYVIKLIMILRILTRPDSLVPVCYSQ